MTIEGNTGTTYGGSVMRRVRRSGIVGYGIPDYEGEQGNWFAETTPAELELVVRRVLQTGTAYSQVSWSATSKATLAAIQHVANLINQQVIPNIST